MTTHAEGFEGIKVLGARIVILIEKDDGKTKSGLIIIEDNREPKFEGKVVATGGGARLDNGMTMPMDVAVGDNVLYSRMAGVPMNYNGHDLLVINERDVIAIIE